MSELLIPMNAQAIWVERPMRVQGPLADFERLPWFDGARDRNASVPHIASGINAQPFGDHNAWLEPGVHLHWTLPQGLTRGSNRRSAERPIRVGDIWMPPAPNRWLVLRRDSKQVMQKAWLVESDYVHPSGVRPRTAIAYPRTSYKAGEPPFFYLGRQIELDTVSMEPIDPELPLISAESSLVSYEAALTALGSGDPVFGSSYPACRSVFGACDPDAEVGQTLSYQVYGWYSADLSEPLAALLEELRSTPDTALDLLSHAKRKEEGFIRPTIETMSETDWQEASLQAINDRLGWTFDISDKTGVPETIVCAGMTVIKPGDSAQASLDTSQSSIGLGSSLAEAAAAFLIKEESVSPQEEDRIVQGLSAVDLSSHALDIGEKLVEARHTEQFRALPGHKLWAIRPEEGSERAGGDGLKLPEEIIQELDTLNGLQEEFDKGHDRADGLRQEMYADWCHYMATVYPEGDREDFAVDVDATRELIERTRLEPLEMLLERLGRLYHGQDEHGNLALSTGHHLAEADPIAYGPLVGRIEGRPFFDVAPARAGIAGIEIWSGSIVDDIVVVNVGQHRTNGGNLSRILLGEGERIAAVFGEAGKQGSGQVINKIGFETNFGRRFGPLGWTSEEGDAFRLQAPEGMEIVGLRGTTGAYLNSIGLMVAPAERDRIQPEESRLALAQRILTQYEIVRTYLEKSVGKAATLALVPGPRYWRPNDPVVVFEDGIGSVPKGRQKADTRFLALSLTGGWKNSGRAFAGSKRAPLSVKSGEWKLAEHPLFFSRSEGENWSPLQVEWEVEMQPLMDGSNLSRPTYASDFVSRSNRFPLQGADLLAKPDSEKSRSYQYFSGRSLLNPSAGQLIVERHKKLPEDLKAKLGQAGESLMAIPLGGFHDQLLMQRQEPQLSVQDPVALPNQREFTTRVRMAMGAFHPSSPIPDSRFHPIRSGNLILERLRVVDSFGRAKSWKPHKLLTTRRMKAESENRAHLPMRLAQAARLDFRWISGKHEDVDTNSHADTSPVCGWLVPNLLDGEIAFYGRSGHLLGSLDQSGTWYPAPGDASSPRSWREIVDLPVSQVVRWLSRLATKGGLGSYIEMLERAQATIDPLDAAQHQSRALLVGKPLAIARARLSLSLQTPPAYDQSTRSLRARIAGEPGNSHGLEQVEFPVRLGEHEHRNDGLCGFWVEKGTGIEESRFYTPHGIPGSSAQEEIRIEGENTESFPLKLKPTGPPERLILLLDPRGVVHASSGVLPRKSIAMPAEHYVEQLENLRFTFKATSILTSPDAVALPLPSEPGFSWSWIERSGENWLETPHHPCITRDDLVAGFGAIGVRLWELLVRLGRIVIFDSKEQGSLMPGDPEALKAPAAALGLDVAGIERGLHQVARSIGEAKLEAEYGERTVARDGWLQLRAAPKTNDTGKDGVSS